MDGIKFSLTSPMGGIIEDRAFSCFAQAQEGDFTIGRRILDEVAEILAYDWVYLRVTPDTIAARYVLRQKGYSYDSLLDQEVDYLAEKVKEEIDKYGAI